MTPPIISFQRDFFLFVLSSSPLMHFALILPSTRNGVTMCNPNQPTQAPVCPNTRWMFIGGEPHPMARLSLGQATTAELWLALRRSTSSCNLRRCLRSSCSSRCTCCSSCLRPVPLCNQFISATGATSWSQCTDELLANNN